MFIFALAGYMHKHNGQAPHFCVDFQIPKSPTLKISACQEAANASSKLCEIMEAFSFRTDHKRMNRENHEQNSPDVGHSFLRNLGCDQATANDSES